MLGGCGFVGRHLVALLVKAGVPTIRVVDKLMPAMAFLSAEHKEHFAAPSVQYVQADISRQTGVDKAFGGGQQFEYVFNLTYDTITYGQQDEVYQQHVVDVSTKLGVAAKQHGVKRFVELSTAQVYESKEKASAESATLKPWTKQVCAADTNKAGACQALLCGALTSTLPSQAVFKLRAENILTEMGLPLVVLRAANVRCTPCRCATSPQPSG